MKTVAVLVTGSLMLALTATISLAQGTDRRDAEQAQKPPSAEKSPSASPATPPSSEQTGGDTKPNAVDPAQGTKTGGNVGEGASYSRSTEKGHSNVSGEEKK
jgi:hypothetical protein